MSIHGSHWGTYHPRVQDGRLVAAEPCADLHGNPNVLTRDVPTSRLTQGSTAQSVLVQVEKAPADAPYRDPHGLPEFVDAPADARVSGAPVP